MTVTARAQEKFVRVNDLRLRYLDWGTTGKTPLVCMHGHTGQARIWDEFAEAMAPHYHVMALDQRGHGQSQWATDGYARDRFVADLGAFLDALSIDKAVLAGLSMGGWNALLYAAENQERVERIIMVDIAPERSDQALQQQRNRPPTPLEFYTLEEAFAWARENDPWAEETRRRQDMAQRMHQISTGKWTWRADPALINFALPDNQDPAYIARYWRSLESLTCPVLEVRGLKSPLVSNDIIERMKKANPKFSSVDVADAGHVVTVDKPQEFITITRDFLGVPA